MSLKNINEGKGCKYCGRKCLCENLECVVCHKKTFAFLSPKRSKCWSEKKEKGPDRVFNSSDDIFLFNCKQCNHEYHMSARLANDSSGRGCPYCARQRLCPDSAKCHDCYTRSFASFNPETVACWSKNNLGSPSQYFMNSKKVVLFDCHICKKEFGIRLDCVTQQLQWCKGCYILRNKSIQELFNVISGIDNLKILTEVKVVCEGRSLFWDMVIIINNRKIYIESDGVQQFALVGMPCLLYTSPSPRD